MVESQENIMTLLGGPEIIERAFPGLDEEKILRLPEKEFVKKLQEVRTMYDKLRREALSKGDNEEAERLYEILNPPIPNS